MKSVSIQFEDQKRPLYQVLADQLEEKIKKGIYKSGQKLPSYRKLIAEYGVNLSTVTHAVKLLEEKQYVLLKQGAGVFVTSKIQDNEKKQTIHLLIAEENSPLSSAFIDQSKLRTYQLYGKQSEQSGVSYSEF